MLSVITEDEDEEHEDVASLKHKKVRKSHQANKSDETRKIKRQKPSVDEENVAFDYMDKFK